MKFSARVSQMQEYVHAGLGREIRRIEKETGRPVVNLSAGIPTFPPAGLYVKKLQEYAAEPDAYLYPPYGAVPELSEAIRSWYQSRFGTVISENELYPLLGSKDGIVHVPLAILDKDDEVLVPDPGYPPFSAGVSLAGGKAVAYSIRDTTEPIDLENLEAMVSPRTRGMWVNFPSNPTGITADLDFLARLVEFARRHEIWLLYDNAYADITFGGFKAPSILEVPGAKDVAVEFGSFSKTFSFAGFRMGWVAGNEKLVAGIGKIKSQVDSGMPLPLQRLGAFALSNFDQAWHASMVHEYERRKDIVAAFLRDAGCAFSLPKGGLYIWAEVPAGTESGEAFAKQLLRERGIAVTPGLAFGANGSRFIRASFSGNVDNLIGRTK